MNEKETGKLVIEGEISFEEWNEPGEGFCGWKYFLEKKVFRLITKAK